MISAVTATYTRVTGTTQYQANDLVGNNTSAGSVTPIVFNIPVGNGRGLKIIGWALGKSAASVTNADFDLFLFKEQPTSTAADNAAFVASNVLACNKGASLIGKLDGAQMIGASDAAKTHYGLTAALPLYADVDSIYGYLVAQAAYTPADSEVFTVTLFLDNE